MDTIGLDQLIENEGEPEGKFLTEVEMLRMELYLEKIKSQRERLGAIKQANKVRQLEADMCRKNSEIALHEAFRLDQPDPKAVSAAGGAEHAVELLQSQKKEFADTLIEKYSITDHNFGFNPETGEIVEKLGGTED